MSCRFIAGYKIINHQLRILPAATAQIITGLNKGVALIVDKLDGWLEAFVLLLPNLILALIILLVFIFVARFTGNLIDRILGKFSQHASVNRLIGTLVQISIIITGIFIALGVLNLDKTLTSLLAGAGIIGLALSFAFQDTAANMISGVTLAMQRPIRVGDLVNTNDFFGTIAKIELRATHLLTPEGQLIIIPNKDVLQKAIINYSYTGIRRVDLQAFVSHGDDLDKVKKVTYHAIEQINYLIPGKAIEIFFTEFEDSAIHLEARYWIKFKRQADYRQAVSDGIMSIKKAYIANNITMPFPIRSLDFGVKGGRNLSDVLPKDFGNQDS